MSALPCPSPVEVRAPATIHDVARAAGVSVSTVSKALNGRDGVAAGTAARVAEAAARLGYRPNPAALLLRRGRGWAITAPPAPSSRREDG